jgi:hypothetical protein
VKRLRRWGFATLSLISLFAFASCLAIRICGPDDSADGFERSTISHGQFCVRAQKEYIIFAYRGHVPEDVFGCRSKHWSDSAFAGNGDEFTNFEAEIDVREAVMIVKRRATSGWWGVSLSSDVASEYPQKPRFVFLAVSTWYPVVGLGVIPILWIAFQLRRKSRRSGGFCTGCGYDLRATPDRCPECGAIPAKKEFIANRPIRKRAGEME